MDMMVARIILRIADLLQRKAVHKRTPEIRYLKIGQIATDPDFVYDDSLTKTYVDLALGKVKIAVTRIATEKIVSGFFTRDEAGTISHVDNIKPAAVAAFEASIRTGVRPVLDLIWNPHAPGGGALTCPDNENALGAYRRLSIKHVPCRILRPKPRPDAEAAIWLENRGEYMGFSKSVAPQIDSYQIYEHADEENLSRIIRELSELCADTRLKIRDFHQDGSQELHYHQMLHALARRHERGLDSMRVLLEMGREEHALALLRILYEGFLNFYLDWLSPEFFGVRLQYWASLKEREARGEERIDDDWRALQNFPGLFGNTAEKAKLSPLGQSYHDLIYPPLSLISHQAYGNVEKEASSFDDEFGVSDMDEIQIGRWLSTLSAALLSRIRNDIGIPSIGLRG